MKSHLPFPLLPPKLLDTSKVLIFHFELNYLTNLSIGQGDLRCSQPQGRRRFILLPQ